MNGPSSVPASKRAFYELAWRRTDLREFDHVWKTLSIDARIAFLTVVKIPRSGVLFNPPGVHTDLFPHAAAEELSLAGLVKIEATAVQKGGLPQSKIYLRQEAFDFAVRMRAIHSARLTDKYEPARITKFIDTMMGAAGVEKLAPIYLATNVVSTASRRIFETGILNSRSWPDWVSVFLKNPMADALVRALAESPGPMDPELLLKAASPDDPEAARPALDLLIGHMALVEDLDPKTKDLVVSFLGVVADRRKASQKLANQRKTLSPVEPFAHVMPHDALLVNDLRQILIEIAGDPIRVKTNAEPFAKDLTRLSDTLDPFPDWLFKAIPWKPEGRVKQMLDVAIWAGLVTPRVGTAGERRLSISSKGSAWIIKSPQDQYPEVYSYFIQNDEDARQDGDLLFFGARVKVLAEKKQASPKAYGSSYGYYYPNYYDSLTPSKEQVTAVRESFYKAFKTLPMGQFFDLHNVVSYVVGSKANPLLCGKSPADLKIVADDKILVKTEESLTTFAENLVLCQIVLRMIPLEAMAVGSDGTLLYVARTPKLDLYYGKKSTEKMPEPVDVGPTKVIVQPDFSVMIIGLDPAPVIELAPFCERVKGRSGQGAVSYKITKEGVFKAVAGGLPAKQVLERLKKHATIGLPDNVAREVADWAAKVRQVQPESLMVLRCQDADTADRVHSALGKVAERLSPMVVGLAATSINSTLRQKLLAQGIMLGEIDKGISKSKPKPKAKIKRASYYDEDLEDIDDGEDED